MHPVVFEIVLFIAFILFVVTQLIGPAIVNKPLFPMFKYWRAVKKLESARAEYDATAIEKEAESVQKEAELVRKQKKPWRDI